MEDLIMRNTDLYRVAISHSWRLSSDKPYYWVH